ncbi:MAG: hypothetical protein WAT79_12905 [Saprospiraceae bacterium]
MNTEVLLTYIRRIVFWTLDFIKGGNVWRHFKQVQDLLNRQEINQKQLDTLLSHTIKTVPFYKKYNEVTSLQQLPVVSKNIIKSEIETFTSDLFDKSELFKLTTSGSTGTPFSVYQDKNKKNRNTADTMVFAEKADYCIGEKLYYLKIWSLANRKSLWTKWIQNIETIDVLNLDDNTLSKLLDDFRKENNPFGVIGYASALETLCKYCDRLPEKIGNTKMVSMISISESLSSEVKQKLTKFFGITVVARYSNVENGILGQQRMDNTEEFELNHASYYFEIMDFERDEVLSDGEIGRIVITDLYNFAMPMLRYDTGDIGSIIQNSVSGKRVLVNLEGRKLDVLYNTQKQLVSSLLVYKNMWKYSEIDQYQLIQKGAKEYTLRISTSGFNRSEEIIYEYKSYLGQDAKIDIEIVHEIPLLDSGKRRKVVQAYYT